VILVEFLRARLDEDKAAAREARAPNWPEPLTWWSEEESVGRLDRDHEIESFGSAGTKADARHIARHDPARVLRQVEALRRVVDCHKHTYSDAVGERPWHGCEVCHVEGDFVIGGGWSELDPDGWCETIRLLTLPYADHPDYNPAWQPAEVTT
jgi:hypothetical protein